MSLWHCGGVDVFATKLKKAELSFCTGSNNASGALEV